MAGKAACNARASRWLPTPPYKLDWKAIAASRSRFGFQARKLLLDLFVFRCYTTLMDTDSETLATQMLWIINRFTFHEKKSVLPYGDLKLYPAEIHLMLLIDDEPGINATEMATRLGVTKGAISQTLSRLEKKGAIHKTRDPYHKNELTASFTTLGQEALEQYRELRRSVRDQYVRYFVTLPDSDREVIGRFLSHVAAMLDRMG